MSRCLDLSYKTKSPSMIFDWKAQISFKWRSGLSVIDLELRKRGDEPGKAANWPMGYSEICHTELLMAELVVGLNSSVRKKSGDLWSCQRKRECFGRQRDPCCIHEYGNELGLANMLLKTRCWGEQVNILFHWPIVLLIVWYRNFWAWCYWSMGLRKLDGKFINTDHLSYDSLKYSGFRVQIHVLL